MIDGIINVYKESGYTSFDVVAKLRGILKQKKIGHTGTLDPMAEGVLPVCLGKATKLVDMLAEADKTYLAVMLLGYDTDTEDVTGEVKNIGSTCFTDEEIKNAISGFIGRYEQLPPMYSAIKLNGKKLYEYAREGKSVERTPREVFIYSISNVKIFQLSAEEAGLDGAFSIEEGKMYKCISMLVHCSKGTYIRSLCRDIGNSLGTYGTLMSLTRNEAHGNKIEDALKLHEIKELFDNGELKDHIMPIDYLLKEYERADIKEEYKKSLLNGNKLRDTCFKEIIKDRKNMIRVYHDETMYGLYSYDEDTKLFKPVKMFL